MLQIVLAPLPESGSVRYTRYKEGPPRPSAGFPALLVANDSRTDRVRLVGHSGAGWSAAQTKSWRQEFHEFCHLLRALGIDADADFFHMDEPGINWGTFGPSGIAEADFVIVAASAPWRERWAGLNDPREGAGVAAEANCLRGLFARDQKQFAAKVVLVELPSQVGTVVVPDELSGFQRFSIESLTATSCEPLLRLLAGRPRYPLPPLGELPHLPPLQASTTVDADDSEVRKEILAEAAAVRDVEEQVRAAEGLLDRRGLPRTRATQPGFGKGRAPATKGEKYPSDPVTEEDVAAMFAYLNSPRTKYENANGALSRPRLQALVAVLWRTGLKITEALDLETRDLRRVSRCLVVRSGSYDKTRVVSMDPWGWDYLDAWMEQRKDLPPGPIFCVLSGASAGMKWSGADVRRQLHAVAKAAGVRRRVAPHQFRDAHLLDLWGEGHDPRAIQRQMGMTRLDKVMVRVEELAPPTGIVALGPRKPPKVPRPPKRASQS